MAWDQREAWAEAAQGSEVAQNGQVAQGVEPLGGDPASATERADKEVALSATKIYGDYTAEQIAREEQRKASIEARGLAVVTTSGALATLLLALAALNKDNLTDNGSFVLPHDAQGPVKWALIFFTIAALGAVLTNFPVWLQYLDPDTVEAELAETCPTCGTPMDVKTDADAEKEVAKNRLVNFRSLQTWNGRKGNVLFAAMVFEFVAVVFIAVAVWKAL